MCKRSRLCYQGKNYQCEECERNHTYFRFQIITIHQNGVIVVIEHDFRNISVYPLEPAALYILIQNQKTEQIMILFSKKTSAVGNLHSFPNHHHVLCY